MSLHLTLIPTVDLPKELPLMIINATLTLTDRPDLTPIPHPDFCV